MRQKLGQHFLKNKEVLEKEVMALDLKKGEVVIEIGPGQGALTRELRVRNKEFGIIAIEKDGELVKNLREDFREDKNLEIIEGDVLKVLPKETSKLKPRSYKIIGNIPYYLTGFLLRTISELENKPELCVFIIQKEVAERIVAQPPKMNKLAASVQFWASSEILRLVSRKDFSPPPEVESALIRLELGIRNNELGERSKAEEKKYFKTVNILFQQPRKTILNNLADGLGEKKSKEEVIGKLKMTGIDPKARPQDLGIEEIVKIAKKFAF